MKRNLYRIMHIIIAIADGLYILNVNRMLNMICGGIFLLSILCSCFLMYETVSGFTVRQKQLLEFGIIALILFLGFALFHRSITLIVGLVFLLCLFLEWIFRLFSRRWEEA